MFARAFIPMATAATAVLIGACGSSSTSSLSAGGVASSSAPAGQPQPSGSSASPAAASGGTTVASTTTSLGTFLVDSNGMTVYLFEADTSSQSACTDRCASAWPPLTTSGPPVAGAGVMGSLLGTSARSDGKTQVTYKGHPLYGFIGDKKPGDVNGEGKSAFGAEWYVVNASTGDKIDNG
jgi:predicted lipoprotein with Yx(FWY)xxD motif